MVGPIGPEASISVPVSAMPAKAWPRATGSSPALAPVEISISGRLSQGMPVSAGIGRELEPRRQILPGQEVGDGAGHRGGIGDAGDAGRGALRHGEKQLDPLGLRQLTARRDRARRRLAEPRLQRRRVGRRRAVQGAADIAEDLVAAHRRRSAQSCVEAGALRRRHVAMPVQPPASGSERKAPRRASERAEDRAARPDPRR